jgi:hypothetical protein
VFADSEWRCPVPTVEEWKTKLRGVIDPCGAVSHAGTRRAQLDFVLGRYKGEGPDGRFTPRAEGLVDTLAKQAEFGALDGLFLGTDVIEAVAHKLDLAVFGAEDADALEREGGGAQPLLDRLIVYVREHPFIN